MYGGGRRVVGRLVRLGLNICLDGRGRSGLGLIGIELRLCTRHEELLNMISRGGFFFAVCGDEA